MSRILLMMLFVLWLSWRPQAAAPGDQLGLRIGIFVGGYFALITTLAVWARVLARRVVNDQLRKQVDRYHTVIEYCRWAIVIWFGVGLYLFGWGELMQLTFGPARAGEPITWMGLTLPTTFIGVLPALLTWMAIWWAQFPIDRAMREESLLDQLESNLPIVAPPRFGQYFAANFRMQLLFNCLPMFLVVAGHDLLSWGWTAAGYTMTPDVQGFLFLGSTALTYALVPVLLIRVLSTESLPNSPLRRKLEQMCRRSGLRYRDILLWKTNGNVLNAGVMGMFGPVRYILLTDALIESMSEEQVEAVFAHEAGHVVHRHMTWFVIFFVIFSIGMASVGQLVQHRMLYAEQIMPVVGAALCVFCFTFISRLCERQADVYAARLMEVHYRSEHGSTDELVLSPADLVAPLSPAIAGATLELLSAPAEPKSNASFLPVGRQGATIVSQALHRVAHVQNIPLGKFEIFHGSISSRLDFLKSIAGHPRQTERFDRQMQRIYGLLLVGLFVSLLWVATTWLKESGMGQISNVRVSSAASVGN